MLWRKKGFNLKKLFANTIIEHLFFKTNMYGKKAQIFYIHSRGVQKILLKKT